MLKSFCTAVFLVLIAEGCSDNFAEGKVGDEENTVFSTRTYKAAIGGRTRTSVEDGKVDWSAGDAVRYYSLDNGEVREFTIEEAGQEATLTLSVAKGSDALVAVYGGTSLSDNTLEGVTVNDAIPSVQSGTFCEGHIAAAKAADDESTLTFLNVNAFIKFSLSRTDVDKVVFTSNDGTMLCSDGALRLTFEESGGVSSAFSTNQSSTVTVNTGGSGTFYIATIPCTLAEGFTAFLYDKDNTFLGSVSSDRTTVLERSSILNLGPLDSHFEAADNTEKILFTTEASGNAFRYAYRIPAISSTRSGNIIAIGDYRYTHAQDVGLKKPIDILCRRSLDGGKKWSEAATAVSHSNSTYASGLYGFGDASIVSDRTSGETLLMCVGDRDGVKYGDGGHLEVHSFRSTDDGASWGEHTDLTDQIYGLISSYYNTLFIASGKIFQSRVYRKDSHYRLYCAALVLNFGNAVFYSDDFGRNWKLLGDKNTSCCRNGDEAKVEELPDGSLVLSSRRSYGRYFNLYHFTDIENGTGKWDSAYSNTSMAGNNSTNGEIMAVKATECSSGEACLIYLQSIPTGSGRSNVSIYWKKVPCKSSYSDMTPEDFGGGWTVHEVTSSTSAYSTMCLLKDGRIGFFYERDASSNSAGTAYNLVYQPFELSTITGGGYRPRFE